MARKSNKTSHILNLLSGEGAPGEEPEKESSQNPDFSGGTKDTAMSDIPTISIVDHLSNDDDPISNLIKENLESQISPSSEQEPEAKQASVPIQEEKQETKSHIPSSNPTDEAALTTDSSSSSYQEKSENAEELQAAFSKSNMQAETHEPDEEIELENHKETIQPIVTQEQTTNGQKDREVIQNPTDSGQNNRITPQDTPSDEQQERPRTASASPADVPEHTKAFNSSPIDGHKGSGTPDSFSADTRREPKALHDSPVDVQREEKALDSSPVNTYREAKTLDSAPAARHTDAEDAVSSSTSVSKETIALDSTPANAHESQTTLNSSSVSEQKSTKKKEELKKIRYVNVMEHIVTERIVSFMESFDMCTCERCITDATALTLTLLPAKYIVVDSYAESPLLNYYSNKFISQVTVEITKACNIVKNNPHH